MFKSSEKWENNGFGGCEKLRYAKLIIGRQLRITSSLSNVVTEGVKTTCSNRLKFRLLIS